MPTDDEEIVAPENHSDEIKRQRDAELKNKLDAYYKQVITRLETEVNMLIRYELKIECESIVKMYNLLFN